MGGSFFLHRLFWLVKLCSNELCDDLKAYGHVRCRFG